MATLFCARHRHIKSKEIVCCKHQHLNPRPLSKADRKIDVTVVSLRTRRQDSAKRLKGVFHMLERVERLAELPDMRTSICCHNSTQLTLRQKVSDVTMERRDFGGTKTEMVLMHVANAGFVGMRLSCPRLERSPRVSPDEHRHNQAMPVREKHFCEDKKVFRQWKRYVKGALAGIMN